MAQKNPFEQAAKKQRKAKANGSIMKSVPADKPRSDKQLPHKMAPMSMTYFDWLMKGKQSTVILKETNSVIPRKHVAADISHPEQTELNFVDYQVNHNLGRDCRYVSIIIEDDGSLMTDLSITRDGGTSFVRWASGYNIFNSSDKMTTTIRAYRTGSGTKTLKPVLYFD